MDENRRLENIEVNALPVYDDRYIKKVRTYGNKFYSNFPGLNVPEDDWDSWWWDSCVSFL